MKRLLFSCLAVGLLAAPVAAQSVPELPFEPVKDFFKMPNDVHFGEIGGVAVNSQGHIFVFHRGNVTGAAYMAQAAQVLEFDKDGKYLREIGKNNFALAYAHAVRIDKQDNIWIVDKGSNMIVKFNPQGRAEWMFGRRGESSHFDAPPDYASQLSGVLKRAGVDVKTPENNNPRNPIPVHRDNVFNQPTDVAWDSKGNSYFSDGYVNSRVGKANAKGEWVGSWGSLGNGPGQFDTPHGIAVSPKDEVYVADRGNRRIQVFDTEGKYLREFTIDVPVDTKRGKIVYGAETPNAKTGSQAPGAPDALCMTPGPNPVLFVGDLYPSRIYKVSLEGKVLGVYGQPGRNPGEFGWIHAIACPSEDEIYVGELINWRVQKLVTKKK
ncbi:MAG: peptidyl-alpha-hydroxyglycine alpha-amidating lyase family protein [Vicinamibacterales bacterium]